MSVELTFQFSRHSSPTDKPVPLTCSPTDKSEKTRTGTHLRGAIGGKRTRALRADGTERRAGVGERALSEELAELGAALGETTPSPRPACATTNKTDRERFRTVCVPLGAAQKLEFITALCVSRESVPLCGAEA